MTDHALLTLSDYLLVTTFVANLLFCLTYQVLARWWRYQFGVTLMVHQVAMTLVLGLAVVSIAVGPHRWITYASLVVFTVIPVALVGRIWVLVKAWRAEGS